MAFFSRLVNYVVNELLVDALANSKTFQRFAVRTDKALREAQKSGTLGDVTKAPGEAAKQMSEFSRQMWETVKAEAAEMERRAAEAAGKGGKGGGPTR